MMSYARFTNIKLVLHNNISSLVVVLAPVLNTKFLQQKYCARLSLPSPPFNFQDARTLAMCSNPFNNILKPRQHRCHPGQRFGPFGLGLSRPCPKTAEQLPPLARRCRPARRPHPGAQHDWGNRVPNVALGEGMVPALSPRRLAAHHVVSPPPRRSKYGSLPRGF